MRLLLYSVLLLLAGCAMLRPIDREGVARLVQKAEEEVSSGDFAGAARSIAAAITHDSGDGNLYLQHGSLLERVNDLPGAAQAYRSGLRRLDADDPLAAVLTWRLALLFALKLEDEQQAERLLAHLPSGSAFEEDLRGVLALKDADIEGALRHLERALTQAIDVEQGATILYHLSLTHFAAGDETHALGDLYHAAARTDHPGLAGDVERLWTRLDADPDDRPAPARKASARQQR